MWEVDRKWESKRTQQLARDEKKNNKTVSRDGREEEKCNVCKQRSVREKECQFERKQCEWMWCEVRETKITTRGQKMEESGSENKRKKADRVNDE